MRTLSLFTLTKSTYILGRNASRLKECRARGFGTNTSPHSPVPDMGEDENDQAEHLQCFPPPNKIEQMVGHL